MVWKRSLSWSVPGAEGQAYMASSQEAQKLRNCFNFSLAGDGRWAGAVGQELVTAVAWTGHSYSIGDE